MLKSNKYSRWYYSIIHNRRAHPLTGYTENHHIMPTALGSPDTPENKVKLSAREHWVCHQLLTRMTEGKWRMKMLHPCVLFKKTSANSRRYQQLKEQRSVAMQDYKHTEETKVKIGNAHRGRKHSVEHAQKTADAKRGIKLSPTTVEKMKISHTGMKHSEATKLKISRGNKGKNKGRIATPEQRQKISDANVGRAKPTDFGSKIRTARSFTLVIQCPNGETAYITFDKDTWAKDRGLRLGTLVSKKGEEYKGYRLLQIIKPS